VSRVTEPILRRARDDFVALSRGHHLFNFLVGVLGAAGAALAELAPSDASTLTKVLFAGGTAFGAFLASYVLTFVWTFLRTPLRQRREAIEILTLDDPQPIMIIEPALDERQGSRITDKRDRLGQPVLADDRLLIAFLRVYNGQEQGDEAATARHVLPEVKIFDGHAEVYHWKGWDELAYREFTTVQEEHAFWLAAKWRNQPGWFVIRHKNATPVKALPEGEYRVEFTLRGYFPDNPLRREFSLTASGDGLGLRPID
jgi:hypothetical protein